MVKKLLLLLLLLLLLSHSTSCTSFHYKLRQSHHIHTVLCVLSLTSFAHLYQFYHPFSIKMMTRKWLLMRSDGIMGEIHRCGKDPPWLEEYEKWSIQGRRQDGWLQLQQITDQVIIVQSRRMKLSVSCCCCRHCCFGGGFVKIEVMC